MTHLSVNVNKLATLRNSRGGNAPDVVAWSRKILGFGVAGITVHPRPDARHVRHDDVRALARMIAEWRDRNGPAEFNVEGYPSPDFVALLRETRPDQATLVPDPPDAITSNAGWNLEVHEDQLREVVISLSEIGVRTSLFVDPHDFTRHQEDSLRRINPARVELYTEAFAAACGTPQEAAVTDVYVRAAARIDALGIALNAGHDLSLNNLAKLTRAIPRLREVSIGHALICEALERGMESTVRAYLKILDGAD